MPPPPMDALPQHIADLIEQGRTAEAVRLLRQETGVDLATARDAVDRLSAGREPLPAPAIAPTALPADVEALARAGQKIEAIKRLREETGLGLKAAKERVEAIPGLAAGPAGRRSAAVALGVALLLLALGLVALVVVAGG